MYMCNVAGVSCMCGQDKGAHRQLNPIPPPHFVRKPSSEASRVPLTSGWIRTIIRSVVQRCSHTHNNAGPVDRPHTPHLPLPCGEVTATSELCLFPRLVRVLGSSYTAQALGQGFTKPRLPASITVPGNPFLSEAGRLVFRRLATSRRHPLTGQADVLVLATPGRIHWTN